MKVLVIGQGGREHVLVWKLSQSPLVDKVFCAPGNAGTAKDGTNVEIPSSDIKGLIRFAKNEKIDLTIPGPEAPLVEGVVDAFQAAGLKIFGPSKAAAELEGSKVFSKELMKKAGVPTAEFKDFADLDDALRAVRERADEETGEYGSPIVVKADGLAAGKGVIICHTPAEAEEAVKSIMLTRTFGLAGNRIVIEDFLDGEEASILALVQGETIIALETSQDHKAAHDGDTGPNTGGMGAYSPAPLVTPELLGEIIESVLIPTVHSMKKEGRPFNGVLYAGLMITSKGPRVLEFNTRFGDPEAQPVLMRLKSDLAEILLAGAEERLHEVPELQWEERPAVCVVMASDGYPGSYEKGKEIKGLAEAANHDNVKVFHAGTRKKGDAVITDGGRVLGVTAIGQDISDAKDRAYAAVKEIRWQGSWYRTDISDKAKR